jgi:hypothetical protein
MRAVTLKLILSCILLIAAAGALIWRISDPGILDVQGIAGIMYLMLILSFVPLVSSIGWLGATLTFPIKRK